MNRNNQVTGKKNIIVLQASFSNFVLVCLVKDTPGISKNGIIAFISIHNRLRILPLQMKTLRHITKYLFILLFLFLLSSNLYAETDKKRYLNLGGGWAYSGLRDMGLSPLYYDGNHGFLSAGMNTERANRYNSFDIVFVAGNISPAINPELTDSEMLNMIVDIDFSHLRPAGSLFGNNNVKLFLGGSIRSELANYRHNLFVNNALTAYSISTLNLNGRITYSFKRNERNYLLAFHTQLPLAAGIIRPSYAYIIPSGFLNHSNGNFQGVISSMEFSTVNRFFRLNSSISLEYSLKNNNAFRIYYKWEYFNHKNENQLTSATHGIGLQTMFNF